MFLFVTARWRKSTSYSVTRTEQLGFSVTDTKFCNELILVIIQNDFFIKIYFSRDKNLKSLILHMGKSVAEIHFQERIWVKFVEIFSAICCCMNLKLFAKYCSLFIFLYTTTAVTIDQSTSVVIMNCLYITCDYSNSIYLKITQQNIHSLESVFRCLLIRLTFEKIRTEYLFLIYGIIA